MNIMHLSSEAYIQLAVGLGLFAFGWMLFRFGINAVGFCLGFTFGYSLYELLLKVLPSIAPDMAKQIPHDQIAIILAGCVTGIIGIFLARKVFTVSIFIGSLAGALYLLYASPHRVYVDKALSLAGVLTPLNHTFGNVWPAVIAILVALLFVYLEKQAIIIVTACIGSYILTAGINVPILFLPLCFIGYLLQTQSKKRFRKHSNH